MLIPALSDSADSAFCANSTINLSTCRDLSAALTISTLDRLPAKLYELACRPRRLIVVPPKLPCKIRRRTYDCKAECYRTIWQGACLTGRRVGPNVEAGVRMEAVRLGIVGCGVIGRVHLHAARTSPLTDVVAVADLRADAAREAAEEFGVPAAYDSAGPLLGDPHVEAVVLAMPACSRTEVALQAFANGKHVLTEKPVAMNAAEVERMIAAKGDLVAGCCSSRFRFFESADVATRFLATDALGQLRVIRLRALAPATTPPRSDPPAWRLMKSLNGGGILVNWGCYDLDYLLGITGWSLEPRLALAQTWTVPEQFQSHVAEGSDAETHVAALVLCEGGTALTLERAEYMASRSEEAWQLAGEKGSLHLRMLPDHSKSIVHDDSGTERGVFSETVWEGGEDPAPVHVRLLEDFASAIRQRRAPKTSLEQALIVQKITDAVYASADEGRAVEIT